MVGVHASARAARELKHCNSLGVFIKQLFHSRLLDDEIVLANLALRASFAIYHLISNASSWNNCKIFIIQNLQAIRTGYITLVEV